MDKTLVVAQDPVVIGKRLRIIRESLRYTQAEIAHFLGVARTTYVSIESGARPLRHEELKKLAKIFDVSINSITRDSAVYVDLIPRFRQITLNDSEKENAVATLNKLVSAEVELENLLGIGREIQFIPEKPLLKQGDVQLVAGNDAIQLRSQLGLGDSPIQDVVSLLELNLGFRVYAAPLAAKISGLYAFDEVIGPCILLNVKHNQNRRNFTAAVELGHFLARRSVVDMVDDEASYTLERRARKYANIFAAHFLMHTRTVLSRFSTVVAGSDKLTRYHILVLASCFNVSKEVMVRRLEEMKLIPRNSWNWFQENGGFTDEEERELDKFRWAASGEDELDVKYSIHLKLLAREALSNSLISEGQLSDLLGEDRITLREWTDIEEASEGIRITDVRYG